MSETLEQVIAEATANFRLMSSQFPGTCIECKERFPEGTQILWAKGVGAKHVLCKTSAEAKPNLDHRTYKNPKSYNYNEVRTVKNCQLCGKDISNMTDACINSDDNGFRRVCYSCFRE